MSQSAPAGVGARDALMTSVSTAQHAVIAFLASPAAHGGTSVERIDTHASVVFLAGDRAWKLKREVLYPYLDYSTPERRRVMCETEFALGRKLAPSLYRRVASVNRDANGGLSLGGAGVPVDWVVEMMRFDQDDRLDHRARHGWLDLASMPALARAVADLHAGAERRIDRGGYAGIRWVIDGNARAFASDETGALNPAVCDRVTASARQMSERLQPLLDERQAAGFVRRCHGDLHLGNVVQLDNGPTLFDPVEFNDAVSCIDVMYDLAFLLMDLDRMNLRRHANAVLNAYLGATRDVGGLAALPLFLSCRAAVRAKTSATASGLQVDQAARTRDATAAAEFLDLADRLIRPEPYGLVAIGGLSGSGKSSLARALAPSVGPAPGAVVARSDVIRKDLHDVDASVRLPASAYTAAQSERVYEELCRRAASVLAQSHGVIADAVFQREQDRGDIEDFARRTGVPFVGLWLNAPDSTLIERVGHRERDASDADEAVVRRQLAEHQGTMRWHIVDAAQPPERVLEDAKAIVLTALGRREN